MKKTIWLILLIIIAIAVIFFVVGGDEETQENDQATTTDEMVNDQDSDETDETATSTDDETGTSTEEENATSTSDDVTVVEYTESGFAPETVTISVGDTVEFTNMSGQEMWVATAVHPTHEVYQGTTLNEHCADGAGADAFDQCETGDSYVFTFDKAGEWGYHNHVNASHSGVIVVTE